MKAVVRNFTFINSSVVKARPKQNRETEVNCGN